MGILCVEQVFHFFLQDGFGLFRDLFIFFPKETVVIEFI